MSDCSAVEEILSLQERCLLYLITHVEDYSPQTLALLPRHLRRALLSSVAPLHLIQLDQTEVASGIDTEALWRDVNKTIGISFLPDPSTSRQRFINAVFAEVTCRTSKSPYDRYRKHTVGNLVKLSLELSLFGLFEKRLSTGIVEYLQHREAFIHFKEADGLSNVFINLDPEISKKVFAHKCDRETKRRIRRRSPDQSLVPAAIQERCCLPCTCRSKNTLATDTYIAQRALSILKRAGAAPTYLLADTKQLVRTGLWLPGREGPLLSFLGNLIRMQINRVDEPPSTIGLFLNAVLSSPNVCLQELSIGLEEISNGKEHCSLLDGDALTSIAPALIAYGQLKSLELVIGDSGDFLINHFITPLHRIIASQKVLECLSICVMHFEVDRTSRISRYTYQASTYHNLTELDDKILLHLLCSLFQNNAFHKLSVSGFAIPQDAFEEIVAAFFESTPSNNDCSLSFRSVPILEGKLQPGSVNTRRVAISQEQAEKFGGKKNLHISNTLPETFCKWFGTIPYPYLGSLKASCHCHGREFRYMCRYTKIF